MVSGATVGAVAASRRPRHPVGWLLLALGLSLAITAAAAQYMVYGCWSIPEGCRPPDPLPVPPRDRCRVAVAAALAALVGVVGLAGLAIGNAGASTVVDSAVGLCLAAVPPAIGATILRYRVYDLDHIISRALVYGLLTVLLGGGYAVVVLGLGQLLGRGSSLAVAGATLAVAAALQPVRRRIRQVVDRRFNRRRHDHRGLQRPAASAGRPGHLDGRAAGRCRPHHAADPGHAVAPAGRRRLPGPAQHGRVRHGAAGGSFPGHSNSPVEQAPGRRCHPRAQRASSQLVAPPGGACRRGFSTFLAGSSNSGSAAARVPPWLPGTPPIAASWGDAVKRSPAPG